MAALEASAHAEHVENTLQLPQAHSRAKGKLKRMTPTERRRIEAKQKFLRIIEEGFSVTLAARSAEVDRKSVYNWRAEDPEFADAWDQAEQAGFDKVEDLVRRAATKDWRAGVAFLEAKRGGQWGAQRKAQINQQINLNAPGNEQKAESRFEQILEAVTQLDDDQDPPPTFKALSMIDRAAEDAVEVQSDAAAQ